MKHVTNLLIKFVMVAVILEVVLLILTRLTFGRILWLSLIITVVAFLIGDLLILPASNNIVASIADVGLALVVIFIYNYYWTTTRISFVNSLVASVILGVGEWFYHRYIIARLKED
ncbi:MAG TPA: DUF2512 family protein [Mobilitalea sp.]|nr:DUF2512 family protein [Mobilitalea sp.]